MKQDKKPTYTIRNTAKTLSSMARLLARAFQSISALKNSRANMIDYNYTASEFFSFYVAVENGRVELADNLPIILKPFKHDVPETFPTEESGSALYLVLRYIKSEKRILLPLITTWTGKEFLSSPNAYVIAYARFDKEESEAMLKAQGFIPSDVPCSKNEFDPEKQFRVL